MSTTISSFKLKKFFFFPLISHPKRHRFGVTKDTNIFNPCNAMPRKLFWDLKK